MFVRLTEALDGIFVILLLDIAIAWISLIPSFSIVSLKHSTFRL